MAPKRKPIIVRNVDGSVHKRYASVKETAKDYNTGHFNVLYWIKSKMVKDGRTFEFENPSDYKEGGYCYKRTRYQSTTTKDSELNPKYTILSYETKCPKVHITPCPFHESPKPMIGSAKCQMCGSFRGINRVNKQVACNRAYN